MSLEMLDIFSTGEEQTETESAVEQTPVHTAGKGFVPKEYFDEISSRAKKACEEKGLTCIIKTNRIYVKTIFDSWYFDVRRGKTCLMHKGVSTPSPFNDGYHVQFREQIEVEDIITYISEHTASKYGNGVVKFSVKIGGEK